MLNILRRQKKTNYCKIVKSLSLLCLGTFLRLLSHYFGLASIVTLLKGENRPRRKYRSLNGCLRRFRQTDDMLPLCNFGLVVCDSHFPGTDGFCSAHGLSHHRLPLFPFKVKC